MAQYAPILDDVAAKAKKINAFVDEHPELINELMALVKDYQDSIEDAKTVIKDLSLTNQCRSFVDSSGNASAKVDIRRDVDGDKFIKEYGQKLLDNCPRCLKVVKSEYLKFPLEGVNLDDYLENPIFPVTVSNKDKGIKALVECLKYLCDCKGYEQPENPDNIENWYAIYETLSREL